ncbi:ATPase, P-type (transporting), HAD superfamily, subfamily IC [Pseudarthrobacter chlorophenolicus A6]|uniref:ATPase, P-type (Transporting), HAD superfamily, subfamily IC n=1 Tax=Pseudarthrobacter chlorophenolicus (strain ATCC 700700 / DSM 12829 / CIP 107037 / JCM 12360 / KCTC 9906 / NCIMB 13794 / A6) TaxID=452863 RepID=B8H9I0_PSECP|nr:HAD-IC family P-type ATPase [Pseudarthrobacter chlorophenolicus]ACL40049.1 ATPase, P-type (transporting), HAD superfamily, subfamily IC [Pseudarthrobacter chlorophenolicus A6]SDQ88868.1 cation-transporting ATPase E [Pseudarthrobacter chlorophenolicus]
MPHRHHQAEEAGLSSAGVAERTARGETNSVPAATSRSLWEIVRANVLTLFNGIVAGSFILLFVLGQWRDALFGFSALGNALIGIIQEYRAKKSLDRLAILHAARSRVIRDGVPQWIPAQDLVPDDVVLLSAGDQVSADLRLLDDGFIEVDESLLTGESEPVPKIAGAELLSGSLILAGSARAVVTRVGAGTFAARLAAEAKRFSLVTSEIRTGLDRVLKVITWLLLPTAVLVANAQVQDAGGWAVAVSSGRWVPAVVGVVASLIAMIPLGLVLLTSVAFAVGGLRLSRHMVLVQELAAVEVLARVDVLCLDKTGTLSTGAIAFDALHDTGTPPADGWKDALAWFGSRPEASTTAAAIGAAFHGNGLLAESSSVPFDSTRKWSSVTFPPTGRAGGSWVLGAPSAVLGPAARLGEAHRKAGALAATGLRTLALAHVPGSLPPGAADGGLPDILEPALLLTFREDIRTDAAATLDYFRGQGVALKIISGDDPRTVAALARTVGMGGTGACDARNLPAAPALLEQAMEDNDVFGSVTPAQKRDMVQALQRRGHTVAMTGDGVNDVLALKEADLGIAMDTASPATKAVARLVLLDGRFDRLPAVVAEGRRAISNVGRVSVVFLSKAVYITAISLVFAALLWPFPYLPRQLSILDGLTIGLPGFFLALQPGGERYTPGFLRRSLSFSLPAGLCAALCVAGVSGYAGTIGLAGTAAGQSAAVITLALLASWILVTASRPLTWTKGLILAGMYVGLFLLFTVPVATEFLRLEWPPPDLLAVSAAAGLAGSAAVQAIAALTRTRRLPGAQGSP